MQSWQVIVKNCNDRNDTWRSIYCSWRHQNTTRWIILRIPWIWNEKWQICVQRQFVWWWKTCQTGIIPLLRISVLSTWLASTKFLASFDFALSVMKIMFVNKYACCVKHNLCWMSLRCRETECSVWPRVLFAMHL